MLYVKASTVSGEGRVLIADNGSGISPWNTAQGVSPGCRLSGAPPRAPPHLQGGGEAGVRRPGWNHS